MGLLVIWWLGLSLPDMALSSAYDGIFARHAGKVPVAYLRALAMRESGMNPRATANASSANAARGLLQVVGVARTEYNRVKGTNIQPDDLWDVDTNVKIAAWLLNTIVAAYAKHPSKNMKTDWDNPEFVKLITAGWNAGYSEGGGVGKVASYLERSGGHVTHDAVVASAGAAGAVATVGNVSRRDWARGVSALYFDQPDRGGSLSVVVLVAVAALIGTYLWTS
jgi:soluble lytic murein transglycosylase-like protein